MPNRSTLRLSLPALLISSLAFTLVACDAAPEEPPLPEAPATAESPLASLEDAEVGPASRSCGRPDQACCGSKRAESLRDLEKRCKTRNFVCPQSESSDICEPCGKAFQHCCVENGKAKCKDGSTCVRTGPGGPGVEAYPGLCLPEE